MRLFIAILLNEEMKQMVEDVQDSFWWHGVRGNYTPVENLHITLAFIGEYGNPEEVMEALERVEFRPFRITMNRIGCFDSLWWAGLEESRELENLVRNIRRALSDAGIPFDRKKFKAHVTFLRKPDYHHGGQIPHMDAGTAQMQVTRISLMRSDRGKSGMIYTETGSVAADTGSGC